MDNDQRQRVIDIFGPDYKPIDVPAIIRQREAEKSEVDQGKANELRQEEEK